MILFNEKVKIIYNSSDDSPELLDNRKFNMDIIPWIKIKGKWYKLYCKVSEFIENIGNFKNIEEVIEYLKDMQYNEYFYTIFLKDVTGIYKIEKYTPPFYDKKLKEFDLENEDYYGFSANDPDFIKAKSILDKKPIGSYIRMKTKISKIWT